MQSPDVCFFGRWAGADSVWEQEKPEASLSRVLSGEKCSKMLQNPQHPVHDLLAGFLTLAILFVQWRLDCKSM
jgi:hypothetical protein